MLLPETIQDTLANSIAFLMCAIEWLHLIPPSPHSAKNSEGALAALVHGSPQLNEKDLALAMAMEDLDRAWRYDKSYTTAHLTLKFLRSEVKLKRTEY